MSKSKKKKKDLDFQKVKLKVGRKIKRDTNETKAEFKSRKIVLKEVKTYRHDDPLTALVRHSDHISHQGKLSMLNHFNSALTPLIASSLTKPILDGLSKFIVDHSDKIRAATFKCLKTCFNHLRQKQASISDFMQSLQPYLDCAYTHVSEQIATDCQKFLGYIVKVNEPQTFETIMAVVLRRYEAGNLTTTDKDLALKLRQQYLRHKQKQTVEDMLSSDKIKQLVWPQTLNLDLYLHTREDEEREVLLVSKIKGEEVSKRYLETILEQEVSSEVRDSLINSSSTKRRRVL